MRLSEQNVDRAVASIEFLIFSVELVNEVES